jgi:hypothetical protein
MNSNSTDIKTDIKEVRKFGAIALVFFGFLCSAGIVTGKLIPVCLFGSLTLLGAGFILIPKGLLPVYTTWMKIAHLIGRTVTILILSLCYYLVITPSAFIKKLTGGPLIPLKPDKSAETYWKKRDEPVQPKERFLKRF